jgi:hypothetical protein
MHRNRVASASTQSYGCKRMERIEVRKAHSSLKRAAETHGKKRGIYLEICTKHREWLSDGGENPLNVIR